MDEKWSPGLTEAPNLPDNAEDNKDMKLMVSHFINDQIFQRAQTRPVVTLSAHIVKGRSRLCSAPVYVFKDNDEKDTEFA